MDDAAVESRWRRSWVPDPAYTNFVGTNHPVDSWVPILVVPHSKDRRIDIVGDLVDAVDRYTWILDPSVSDDR